MFRTTKTAYPFDPREHPVTTVIPKSSDCVRRKVRDEERRGEKNAQSLSLKEKFHQDLFRDPKIDP